MEQKQKLKKFSRAISFLFEGAIAKLLKSTNTSDRALAIELILTKLDFGSERNSIQMDLSSKNTVVIRDRGNNRELVIGNYGALVRKCTNTCAFGVVIYEI